MGKWSVIRKCVFVSAIMFLSFNSAFSGENDPIILPKYLPKGTDGIKMNKVNEIEKKISGQLKLQLALKNSYREQPTTERLNAMQNMGMRTVPAEMDKQLVYIHAKEKLSDQMIASLKEIGVIVHEDSWIPPLKNHPTGYVTASMPVDRLYDLAAKTFVVRLETAEQMLQPNNNLGAKSIRASKVWADYGYDGSGVKIAILDSGLDTTHADIPAPIASKDYSNYPTLDDSIDNLITGHGTHVTGSVLGRGTLSSGKYKGMAYDADLIFLKIGNDTTSSASSAAITNAIKASVDTYNADIITMSYGGLDIYNDGSDEECQAVDYAFSQGALVFMSAGNNAANKTHYSGKVAAGKQTKFIKVKVASGWSALYFFLDWFDGTGLSNDLDLSLYDKNKVEMTADIINTREAESPRGTEAREVYYNYYVQGPATYYLKVKNNSDNAQSFHIYSLYSPTTFQKADPKYTIGSPAVADKAIAVASYVTRKKWTDYLGENIYYIKSTPLGEMSFFSSRGPRIDGAKKPDIATPGEAIISARDKIYTLGDYDNDPFIIDNDGINNGMGPADYFVMRGTSMAAPIAAGAAALLMEAKPSLKGDPESVRDALFQTASNRGKQKVTDGYGKMNVLKALKFVLP